MCMTHLADFTKDCHGINPKLTIKRSSLKPLFDYLQSKVEMPSPITEKIALSLCKSDGRVDKYRPAITRLCSVWGKGPLTPYPAFAHGKLVKQVKLNRLVFRGDNRTPATIFSTGFEKWAEHKHKKPTYQGNVYKDTDNFDLNTTQAGDLDAVTGICVTPDMFVSALFPLPDKASKMDTSYLYVCLARQGYDTNGRQVLDALRGFKRVADVGKTEDLNSKLMTMKKNKKGFNNDELAAYLLKFRSELIGKLLYGRELAVDAMPSKDIFLALKISRTWNKLKYSQDYPKGSNVAVRTLSGADWWSGGTFKILEMKVNQNIDFSGIDTSFQTAVLNFAGRIEKDIKAGTVMTIPAPASGYAKSHTQPTDAMVG